MFTDVPTYSTYRTLALVPAAKLRGEDVYALQTSFGVFGYELAPSGDITSGCDGILGSDTAKGIIHVQKLLQIEVDGLAGGGTQQAICKSLCNNHAVAADLPPNLAFGQVMHESSCRLGNYSPRRVDKDAIQTWQPSALRGFSFDAGAAQQNSAFNKLAEAFDTPLAIHKLGLYLLDHYKLFAGVPEKRRWMLASGAWNAPAYAKYIANEEGAKVPVRDTARPSLDSRAKLEGYMASTTSMVKW